MNPNPIKQPAADPLPAASTMTEAGVVARLLQQNPVAINELALSKALGPKSGK